MKKFLFSFAIAAMGIILVGLSSCTKQEDFTGHATAKAANANGSLDMTGSHSYVEPKEDMVIPFTLTLSEPQIVDVIINVTHLPGGTATVDADFSYDHQITIPAHHTSGVCEVKILADAVSEYDESFTLQFGDSTTTNVNFTTKKVDFSITSHDLALVFDWGGTADLNGTSISFCDSVDMDIYVMDVDTTDLGIYGAATGACPESLTISNFENGDYYLWVNLYLSNVKPDAGTIEIPLAITVARGSDAFQSISAPAESLITSMDPDGAFKSLIKVTVSDDAFVITNPYNGDVLIEL